MQYWLRFGLPIGSAFVVAVILDNIIAVDWLIKESILSTANETSKNAAASYHYHSDQYPLLYVFIRTVLALGLWVILVRSPKTLLFIWIVAAVSVDCLRHGNLKMIFDAISSFNIYLLIFMPIIRVYLYQIFIEVARVIEKQKEPRLLVGSYEGADEDLESLVPIGYDGVGIWKYYDRFPMLGTKILLIVDSVWIFIALPAVKAALGGFGGFLITVMGCGLNGYAILSILQKQPSGVVIWRILYFCFIILMVIAFGSEFMDTRKSPSEQGTISTLTLALMTIYKIFLCWFSTGIEGSMDVVDFSTNANNQLAQIEGGPSYHVAEGDWNLASISEVPGEVIITELEGRDSRLGWESRSGRVSRTSRSGWGSQSGLGIASSREGMDSRSGWGSQSAVSDSLHGADSRSILESQPQSVRTSRDAISTVSSVSGWTTASERESRSDVG
ncbi:hypothetical protein Ocin01_10166 [Orchesella cincta]|uniref:Transmembrane protein n=1 Tax=Orchesella cincta TaxID=48709 RepID=A0A1D2MUE7_ORCCI|nr:hypothetical protein Ocin01_10166 [Orchesella cincta]